MQLTDLKDLFGKKIAVTMDDGVVFEGIFYSYTWASDAEDGRESIDLDCTDGRLYSLHLDEIKEVKAV